ncbi:MAG TPA: serine hydrolase domain-containing protein [Mucilaginibacter sp.]|nr:serine hydrolase domain-containing protein [Mucilaginibacter sp.]
MIKKSVLLFCVLITIAYSSIAQSLNKPKLDSLMAVIESNNKAMGSLAIAVNGAIVYDRAIGYLSVNGNDKMTADIHTKYRIGSISKMFTAVMIFQLVEEGKLSLDAPLSTWYPELPNAAKITIGDMLDHRSGLHNFTNDPAYGQYMTQPRTEAEMVAVFAKQQPDFEPGTKAQYSNTNFVLLGYIIEKITGKSYPEELKERIVSKLKLKDTYYGGKTSVKNNEAYSYSFAGSWSQMPETDMSIPGGAGAILSTPSDLTRFIDALFAGKLISMDHLNLMKTQRDNYGMAMFEMNFDAKKGYGHNGGIDGFTSVLTYFPDEKLAFAYCSNGGSYNVRQVNDVALSIYFNKPFALPDFKTIALKSEDLDKYLGVYSSTQIALKITITKDKATLIAQGSGQPQFPLAPTAPDKFSADAVGASLEFDPTKNQFILIQGGAQILFTRDK